MSREVDLSWLRRKGDALLIVPPFALLEGPSLAVHLLQACAREAGFQVAVLYANMSLAAAIGAEYWQAIYNPYNTQILLGERLFSKAAFGLPLLGRRRHRLRFRYEEAWRGSNAYVRWSELEITAGEAIDWVETITAGVAKLGFRVVGCTTCYQQTCASVALLDRIKRARPEVVTVLGGANCEGDMAAGVASLGRGIDYIFSGESESSFPEFLGQLTSGQRPPGRIITGEPVVDLDSLPTPDFTEFFEQLHRFFPDVSGDTVRLPYESSRGCWWGHKRQCTFCGFNGLRMKFRRKSPHRVHHDLEVFSRTYPTRAVEMVDNVMPRSYFQTLLPKLAADGPAVRIFYEQRSDLSLKQMVALKKAGCNVVLAGIEALSTSLLNRMDKGVSAAQNIAMLRYARSIHLGVTWNFLCEVPGDQVSEYELTLSLIPLLRHLSPPWNIGAVRIDRFSRYVESPEELGIDDLRPHPEYAEVFPLHADLSALAYHFEGDYRSVLREHPEIVGEIIREVERWSDLWTHPQKGLPSLNVGRLGKNTFMLRDTRGLPGTWDMCLLDREQAVAALTGEPFVTPRAADWAIGRKVAMMIEGVYVPLATAHPDLLAEFEAEASPKGSRVEHELLGRDDVEGRFVIERL